MKCPKCSYISFDHNQVCPKCSKDISGEQAKLNLPTYKDNPPSLLGMLIGAGDESSAGFTIDSSSAMDTPIMETDGIDFGEEDQELEISLNDESGEFELPEIGFTDSSEDIPDIELGSQDEEPSLDFDQAGDDAVILPDLEVSDELEFNLDDISTEEDADTLPEVDALSLEEDSQLDDGQSAIELDVNDLKINETGELEISSFSDDITASPDILEEDKIDVDSETALDLGIISIDETSDTDDPSSFEITDLTVGDIEETEPEVVDNFDFGDLTLEEVGGDDEGVPAVENIDIGPSETEEEESLDLGELTLEEIDVPDKEEVSAPEGIDLSVAETSDEESLDLGDLALEEIEASSSEEEESLDLGDFTFEGLDESASDETGELESPDLEEIVTGESEKNLIMDEPLSLMDDLEKIISDDGLNDSLEFILDESSDGEEIKEEVDIIDDELTIDLENLDLDLDLDDSSDK